MKQKLPFLGIKTDIKMHKNKELPTPSCKKLWNEQISILKGIGIILMVIGHSGATPLLYDIIYLFHMPLFYFAAGYFFTENTLYNKKSFITKRLKSLYKPFVKYGLLFLILHNLFVKFGICNCQYSTNDFLDKTFRLLTFRNEDYFLLPFWFLRSLFICSIEFCFLFYFIKKLFSRRFITILSTFILCLYIIGVTISKETSLTPNITRELLVLPLFLSGFLFHKYESYIIYSWLFAITCVFLLFYFSQYQKIELVISQIGEPVSFLTGSFLGCYLTMYAAKKLIKIKQPKNLLIFIGKHTLEILTYHLLAFKIVQFIEILYYGENIGKLTENHLFKGGNGLNSVYYIFAGIAIPILLVLLKKMPELITGKLRIIHSNSTKIPY